MNYLEIIDRYYAPDTRLRDILLTHSRSVTQKALTCLQAHPELDLDAGFVEEAAMLHDIGIFQTRAPGIACMGSEPYICHGVIGAELLRKEGFPKHARVCERHTGTGITEAQIKARNLPLPLRDYTPETLEEQLICYADKFFSKSNLDEEKSVERVVHSLEKFGEEGVEKFLAWQKLFG